jgi:glucosylceramidase
MTPLSSVRRAMGLLAASLLLSLAACASAPPDKAMVQVWTTTGDGALLLASQPDLVFASTPAPSAQSLPVLIVDPGERHQSMVGFGAAVTDASAWLIQNRMTPAQRDALMQELFGREGGGLGFSFTRLTIGASDFSPEHYSLDDAPGAAADPDLKFFSLDVPAQTVFPTVRQALAVNPDLKVMASPWSAPAWMKTTNSLIKGQLKPEAYPVYARFFTRYVQEAEQHGVPTDYLSIQNEPDFEPENYPGMRWPAADRARFFGEHLGPAFKRAGVRTAILDWDHNWDQPQQPLAVLADLKAASVVSGVAWHCYAGDVSAQEAVAKAHPGSDVFFTECSAGAWSGSFEDSFAWTMRNLIIGATRGGARGVLMWNLALDEKHGPHKGGCGDCRGLVTIDSTSGAVTRSPEYYAFGQASRFVKPGAVRVGSTATVGEVASVAFVNPDGESVLVVFNSAKAPATVRIQEGQRWFDAQIPARAATTFRW